MRQGVSFGPMFQEQARFSAPRKHVDESLLVANRKDKQWWSPQARG